MANINFNEVEVQQLINKKEFTEEEIEKAISRNDMDGVKTKTMKLQMDKLEDRLMAQYLEDKSFTEIVWRALKIYKRHFDAEVLLQEKLDNLQRGTEMIPVQQVQAITQMAPVSPMAEEEIDDDEFGMID